MAHDPLSALKEALPAALLLESPTYDGNKVKMWMSKDNIYFRVLTPLGSSDISGETFSQGELMTMPVNTITGVNELNRREFTLSTTSVGELTLRSSASDEHAILVEGFRAMVEAQETGVKMRSSFGSFASLLSKKSKEERENEDDEASILTTPPEDPIRVCFWIIVSNPWFDPFIIFCILLNCVVMAMDEPNADPNSNFSKLLDLFSDILLYIFTAEAAFKIAAFKLGGYFCGPDGAWNRLDFFIVLVGFLNKIPSVANLTILRTLRVLRPLRTLGKLEGMKALVNTILLAIEPLSDVVALTTFIFFVFSVLGLELFRGLGSNRCLNVTKYDDDSESGPWTVLSNDETFPIEDRRCGGYYSCPSHFECYHAGRDPPQIYHQNMNNGATGYDNIGQAMLTVFVATTLEGWVDVMYLYQDSSNWILSTVFHIFMVLLGSFFCFNLALAIIADTFEETLGQEDKEDIQEHEGKVIMQDKTLEYDAERDTFVQTPLGVEVVDKPPGWLRGKCHDLSYSPRFNQTIIALIILNTISLACEHVTTKCKGVNGADDCIDQAQEMSEEFSSTLVDMNYFFVAAFALEMVIKIVGMRLSGYFSDSFNTFDFIIVVVSFLEIGINNKGLTALRTFRLARLFKMTRSWKSLRAIVESLLRVLPRMTSMALLLLLYMFISAVAGMQLLGTFLPSTDRSRFNTFGIAMLTIFQFLTGENWNEAMYGSIEATGSYLIVIYYLLVIIFGIFIVLNLFLAIMLSDFNCGDPPDINLSASVWSAFTFCCGKSKPSEDDRLPSPTRVPGRTEFIGVGNVTIMPAPEEMSEGMEMVEQAKAEFTDKQLRKIATTSSKESIARSHSSASSGVGSDPLDQFSSSRSKSLGRKMALMEAGKLGSAEIVAVRNEAKSKAKELREKARLHISGVSLGLFPPENHFRKFCTRVVRHPYFENVILVCIIVSSILIACDGPTTKTDNFVWKVLNLFDFIFIIIFTIEAALKIVTLGFYWCPDGYLKDGWNVLDFFIVIISWISWITTVSGGKSGLDALRTLRSLRALRPLRTIQRAPGMKLVVDVLLQCAPVFINICFVAFFFFLVFAIMGVQFFAGKFWTCNDTTVKGVKECFGSFVNDDGETVEREWSNQVMNFDNVFNALLTLYEVSSLEMWLDVMYAAMDAPEDIGEQPKQERNWVAAFFFVVFIIVGVFIILNLFVGAVVDKFNDLKEESGGRNPLQTEEQKQYTDTMSIMVRMRPVRRPLPPNKNAPKYRHDAYRIVMWDISGHGMGNSFELVICSLVLLNIITMAMSYWKRIGDGDIIEVASTQETKYQNFTYNQVLNIINDVFTLIFLLEMLLKWSAWGLHQYFVDYWNKLDFVLVVSSVIAFLLERLLTAIFPFNPAILRIVRVAKLTRAMRSIRVIRHMHGIARLIDTLAVSVPAMANVASLAFLVIFVFTVMGMDFFGDMDVDKEYINGFYNDHCNFRYFGTGFMLLFRAVTGESWNGVMHDIMTEHPQAWIFFLVYMIFVTSLLFELLTAIVLDEFGRMNDYDALPIGPDLINNFNTHWAQLDPLASQMIPQHKLLKFLQSIEPPLFDSDEQARKAVYSMNVASTEVDGIQKIHYVDTLVAVVRYKYLEHFQGSQNVQELLDTSLIESPELTMRIVSAYPHLKKIEKMDPKNFREELAATQIQTIFKARTARRESLAQKKLLQRELATLRGQKDITVDIETLNGVDLRGEIRKHRGMSGSDLNAESDREHADSSGLSL